MARRKRKLTAEEKRRKRERKKNTMIIFMGGKQKRVPRPPTIEGLPIDAFIARNADPIWLHQNEMWECMPPFHDFAVKSPVEDQEYPPPANDLPF